MAKAQEKALAFEEILKELENVVSKLELGNLPLDEALNEFEKGVKLSKQGQVQLQNAEQRIQILLTESSEAELTDFANSEN
ncbi:exodeoxyribonuclease VII small subunit [Orbus sturtevantii]|uniref:exodeoxyribonuclease VII small subunit n=1 Tax=Orbus sturtevantii TaxID=3074109 RepID=UPI00370DA7CF